MEPMSDLSGRTAVVFGGTSGIGQAIALGLAEAGADVVATSRRMQEVENTAARIVAIGRKTISMASDVSDRGAIEQLHQTVIDAFGRVDILFNSAGITQRVPTLDCGEDEWNRVIDTNLTGTLRACQIFGKTMLAQKYGRIINIASLATFVAFHEVTAYGASKAAVGALTKSLAVEWAKHGVCINAIAPGIFPTDLNRELLDSPRGKELIARTPMARFGTVDEVVGAAVYLASDESAFTTGQIIAVDGGF